MEKDEDEEPQLRVAALGTATSALPAGQGEDEARARLAAVIESSDDAIISKSLEGIIETWNKGAEQMFGYCADEMIGQPITRLIPPQRIDEELQILERLKRGERISHFETIRMRKDGVIIHVSLSVSPIMDGSGVLVGASKIARDITLRKHWEQARKDENRILELLNRTGPAIASQLELKSLAQSVIDTATALSNAAFGAFFFNANDDPSEAFESYTLSGVSHDAFAGFRLPRSTALLAPTFRGEGVIRSGDITKDPRFGKMPPHFGIPPGHLPIRSYLATSVVSRVGKVLGGLFCGHPEADVFTARTERLVQGVAAQAAIAIDNARLYEDAKRAAEEREQLLEAERAARAEAERIGLLKDEFLATLSHELRTPLSAILGWAQVLRAREQPDETMAQGLEVIERNSRLQAQLIEDLLDMSRIISGKMRLDVQRVDLQEVVRAVVDACQVSADAKAIRLQLILDPVAGPVRGDPARIQQCLWNLLSNAIKFTPKGGRVQVILERVNSHVELCVCDSGQGIKPDFLRFMFERFRQADPSTTRRHGGLGLGLSIVKHLVELHGGRVRASSAGEGKGATFTIELPTMVINADEQPIAREHPRSAPLLTRNREHPSLNGIAVLVVDDEPDARALLQRVLEDCGARVMSAASVEAALEQVVNGRPDVIISDIGMPGEDGYALIQRVRRLPPEQGGRTPAAALTAFARAEDRTRALRAGFQTHIAKPVEPTELSAVVASLVFKV